MLRESLIPCIAYYNLCILHISSSVCRILTSFLGLLTGRVGSGQLPYPTRSFGSGRVTGQNGQTGLEYDKSVNLQYLDEYCSDLNDFTVIRFISMRRIQ